MNRNEMEQIAGMLNVRPDAPTPKQSTMPCEVTACIPAYNAICTLGLTLWSLEWGAQSIPLRVILAENGSWDGTQAWLRDMAREDQGQPDSPTRKHWLVKFAGIQVIEVPHTDQYPPGFPQAMENMVECLRQMWPLVETPYLLTVDADVQAPSGSLRTMLEALKQDEKLGMVGIIYEREVDHVKHGLAMLQTEIALQIDLVAGQCPCSHMHKQVEEMGYKVRYLSPLSARHMKREL